MLCFTEKTAGKIYRNLELLSSRPMFRASKFSRLEVIDLTLLKIILLTRVNTVTKVSKREGEKQTFLTTFLQV